MKHEKLTARIYLSAAVATSAFAVTQSREPGGWPIAWPIWLIWLVFVAIPLLFVFARARLWSAVSLPLTKRQRFAVLANGAGFVATDYLFVHLVTPFGENPLRDAQSLTILLVPLVVLPVFLVAAVSLQLKGGSSLVRLASALLWPYWLVLALVTMDRWFEGSPLSATLYFLCFLSPIIFAFAAGAVSHRPNLAHSIAISGLMGVPWIYQTIAGNFEIDNLWTAFNVPDRDIGLYPLVHDELTILTVGLISLALVTAALRLLPAHWKFRMSPLRDRTWPAFAASFFVIAFWFSRSVMPYRIPGALDYHSDPVLQILRVEKRGLQFHELSFSVWARSSTPDFFSSSRNDRRLFQYRFRRKTASGPLPKPLAPLVKEILQSSDFTTRNYELIKPLRMWNADGWYVFGGRSGPVAYTTENGKIAPPEVTELFHELETTPRSDEILLADTKDVCLGFCYDPAAELGWLYANHRCFNQGRGFVCH